MTIQTQYTTIPLKTARAEGYKVLTYPFPPREYPLLEKTLTSLRKTPAGAKPIDFALVVEDAERPNEISVFRKNISA